MHAVSHLDQAQIEAAPAVERIRPKANAMVSA